MCTLDLLKQLVAIPSVNNLCIKNAPELTGEKRIADFIESLAVKYGIAVTRIESAPGRPTLILEIPAKDENPKAPMLACFAHMDTVWVPAYPEPFDVIQKEDGFLHGLGVTDDKGSIAAALLAIFRLKELGGAPCRFAVACTSDEEAGFTGIESILPKIIRPDAAIVMEGTLLDIVTAHKGTVRWRVTATGVSVHSSLVPAGENAIYKAAKLILAIEKLSDELIRRNSHKRLAFPTINVGTIQGGTQPNSVPDLCEFMLDRRLLPGETVEQAESEVRAALDSVGEYKLSKPTMFTGSFEMDEQSPFVLLLLEEARKIKPDADIRGLYCSTEAGFTILQNIPTVVFGPGDVRTAHSLKECMDLAQIDQAVEIIVNSALHGNF